MLTFIDDVSLKDRYLTVNKMEETKSRIIVNSCMDNSERSVYLNSDAIKIFETLLSIRKKDEWMDLPYLFLNKNSSDKKMHLRALDNRLRKIQRTLGFTDYLPERSPHDLRRTYASIQYLQGIDVKMIQSQLGHASTIQTWNYIKDIVDKETRLNTLECGCILA